MAKRQRTNNHLEVEDTKGVIRIRISKKNRQHNGQKEKVQMDKQRSTKHTYKTKDRVTRTSLTTGGKLRSEMSRRVLVYLIFSWYYIIAGHSTE